MGKLQIPSDLHQLSSVLIPFFEEFYNKYRPRHAETYHQLGRAYAVAKLFQIKRNGSRDDLVMQYLLQYFPNDEIIKESYAILYNSGNTLRLVPTLTMLYNAVEINATFSRLLIIIDNLLELIKTSDIIRKDNGIGLAEKVRSSIDLANTQPINEKSFRKDCNKLYSSIFAYISQELIGTAKKKVSPTGTFDASKKLAQIFKDSAPSWKVRPISVKIDSLDSLPEENLVSIRAETLKKIESSRAQTHQLNSAILLSLESKVMPFFNNFFDFFINATVIMGYHYRLAGFSNDEQAELRQLNQQIERASVEANIAIHKQRIAEIENQSLQRIVQFRKTIIGLSEIKKQILASRQRLTEYSYNLEDPRYDVDATNLQLQGLRTDYNLLLNALFDELNRQFSLLQNIAKNPLRNSADLSVEKIEENSDTSTIARFAFANPEMTGYFTQKQTRRLQEMLQVQVSCEDRARQYYRWYAKSAELLIRAFPEPAGSNRFTQ